ncbi:hypothetical protein Dimus_039695 [Dionaea muscipula]
MKGRISYLKVPVDVNVSGELVEAIEFRNMDGQVIKQWVLFEWLLIKCNMCKGWGHKEERCRRQEGDLKGNQLKMLNGSAVGNGFHQAATEEMILKVDNEAKGFQKGKEVVGEKWVVTRKGGRGQMFHEN